MGAVPVVVLGLAILALTAYEYVSGLSLGIDQLVAQDHSQSPGSPGRMAIGTIFSLTLVGASILTLNRSARGIWLSEWSALGVTVIAGLAIVGDLFRVDQLAGLPGYAQMAANTALSLILLVATVVALRPEHMLYRAVASRNAGAAFVRRYGWLAVLLPLGVGAIVLNEGRAGAFGLDFAVSLGTFVAVAIAVLGVGSTARYIRLSEAEGAGRREAEVYRLIIETANEGVWTTDEAGRTLYINRRMLEMLGYRLQEVAGRPALDLSPTEIRERQRSRMGDRVSGKNEGYETAFIRKAG